MNKHQTLVTEEEISAYVHRSRMQILAILRQGPATATMIASQLGVHPANLTRHIRTLRDAGLLSLVETRDTGRNLERWYAASARSYDVSPDADGLTSPHKIGIAFARSELSSALAQMPDSDPGNVTTLVVRADLTKAQIAAFQQQVSDLALEFEAADAPENDERFHLVLALYPQACDDDAPEADRSRRVILNSSTQRKQQDQ